MRTIELTRLKAGETKGKQTALKIIAAPPVMDASKRPVLLDFLTALSWP